MARETDDPRDEVDGAQDTARSVQDSLSTGLSSAEQQIGAVSRKVAFFVLAASVLPAAVCAVFWWYMWVVTVQACANTYIWRTTDSVPLTLGQTESLQALFSGLDISSFSAMILALLFTRWTYVGGRNSIRYFQRDRSSYFGRAYHSILFTEGFESLCIRMGLLGTLLSFLLAAVSQIALAQTTQAAALGTTVADRIAAVAREPADAAGQPGADTEPTQITSATSKLSSDIFLLLCASLVSTFVGTGVAYLVTPSLNWLNERAVGLHQLSYADPRMAAEEFFRQIARTSERLAQFETTTMKLAEAADHISSFEVSVGTAARKLTDLITGLEGAVHTFDVSTQSGKQLARKLDHLEAMSDRMRELLDRLPERLNDPLKNMSLTAGKFRDAAMSGEAAFRELKAAAGTAGESLNQTTQRANSTWQMLHQVQESLGELAKNEEKQTAEVAKLARAFAGIGTSLDSLVRELDSLGTHLRHRDMSDREAIRLSATHRSQLVETAGSPSGGDDGRAGTSYSPAQSVADLARERPWWRRIFG
jgi:ABC-type transporter Mla subunit MlaD